MSNVVKHLDQPFRTVRGAPPALGDPIPLFVFTPLAVSWISRLADLLSRFGRILPSDTDGVPFINGFKVVAATGGDGDGRHQSGHHQRCDRSGHHPGGLVLSSFAVRKVRRDPASLCGSRIWIDSLLTIRVGCLCAGW